MPLNVCAVLNGHMSLDAKRHKIEESAQLLTGPFVFGGLLRTIRPRENPSFFLRIGCFMFLLLKILLVLHTDQVCTGLPCDVHWCASVIVTVTSRWKNWDLRVAPYFGVLSCFGDLETCQEWFRTKKLVVVGAFFKPFLCSVVLGGSVWISCAIINL